MVIHVWAVLVDESRLVGCWVIDDGAGSRLPFDQRPDGLDAVGLQQRLHLLARIAAEKTRTSRMTAERVNPCGRR